MSGEVARRPSEVMLLEFGEDLARVRLWYVDDEGAAAVAELLGAEPDVDRTDPPEEKPR